MPVWVRGNVSSGVFVVYLHGGPGAQGLPDALDGSFAGIEREYAVVYWDQRGGGSGHGQPPRSTFGMEHFVVDTGKLMALLRARYDVDELWLLGQSFGGCLGAAVLQDEGLRPEVDGFIEVDGGHNMLDTTPATRQWAIDGAQAKIDAGEDVARWERALERYADNPTIDAGFIREHAGILDELHGYYLGSEPSRSAGDSVRSPLGWVYEVSYGSEHATSTFFDVNPGFFTFDFRDGLRAFTGPALVIWGRLDGAIPVALAQDAFDALGSAPQAKQLVVFEHSAHFPHHEESHAFNATVVEFMRRHVGNGPEDS